MMLFGEMVTDDTWWDMTDEQRTHFDQMRVINEYLRRDYHSMKDVLWLFDNYNKLISNVPVRLVSRG